MQIPVKLTKLSSSHSNLRTSEVIGFIAAPPEIGISLVLISEPITEGTSFRMIHTTNIQTINNLPEGKQQLETENSVYELEYL